MLIVDDDPVQRRLLEAMVQRFGYQALVADGGDAAMALLGADAQRIDCVVLDLVMPDLDGLGVLARMREAGLDIPVIVQTAHGGIDNVVSAMRAGAIDFVVKPASPERLQVSLRNALATQALAGELQRIKRSRDGTLTFADIITRSPAMQPVLRAAEKAAASTIPVLIEGESGVGKELIARAIHGSGARRAKPFVAVNCGAMPENLVESILFGHEKGAFTGATDKHTGKFVEADGGTLFLDEVGELPPAAQVKLLRALQEGEVEPVGGDASRQGRCAHHLRHQPRPDRRREGRALPRGPVLPPARVSDLGAAAAPAARGHPRTGASFPRPLRRRGRQARARHRRRGDGACSRPIAGRAMCASSKMRSSARSCWPTARRSASHEFPQIAAQIGSDAIAAQPMIEPSPAIAAAWPDVREASQNAAALTMHTLRLTDAQGDVRPLEEIEREVIRFAIAHYREQMSEVARRLKIGRSTLYRKLEGLGLDDAPQEASEKENVTA